MLKYWMDLQQEMWKQSRENLERGTRLWDLLRHPPRVEVGITPKDTVYRENKTRLYNYRKTLDRVRPTPVLIVYALINRLYILDLHPDRSFVKHLLDSGLDVFAVDWGEPGPEDRSIPLDHYLDGYLHRMVEKVCEVTGSPQISLFGYCIGGTMAATYAALHPERIRNLVLLTTPINFDEAGYFRDVVANERFPLDAMVDTWGNIPPWVMQSGFKLLNPLGDAAKVDMFFKKMTDDGFLQNFFAVEKWVNDNVPFPGEAYRKFIQDLYRDNLLYKGEFRINGRTVDPGRIDAAHLSVAADDDDIVPPESAACIKDLISSRDSEVVTLPGGHVGVIIGGRAKRNTWPRISDWLLLRSE